LTPTDKLNGNDQMILQQRKIKLAQATENRVKYYQQQQHEQNVVADCCSVTT